MKKILLILSCILLANCSSTINRSHIGAASGGATGVAACIGAGVTDPYVSGACAIVGAFAGANGILFEGLTNPKLLAKAFSEGIDTSALLKLGPGSAKAQAAYRELLELGVVNSQVQIGDLINLLRDAGGGANIAQTDALLKPFFRKLKKLGQFFQGKYVAEDDTWKITNYVVELDRLKQAAVKQGTRVNTRNYSRIKTRGS